MNEHAIPNDLLAAWDRDHLFHPEELRAEDFVFEGYNGVKCVEAGGPPHTFADDDVACR